MTERLRVVLDTNVLVSALVFGGGLPSRLRARWQQGAFVALAADFERASRCRIVRLEAFLHP